MERTVGRVLVEDGDGLTTLEALALLLLPLLLPKLLLWTRGLSAIGNKAEAELFVREARFNDEPLRVAEPPLLSVAAALADE
jgi:hypothetical protein